MRGVPAADLVPVEVAVGPEGDEADLAALETLGLVRRGARMGALTVSEKGRRSEDFAHAPVQSCCSCHDAKSEAWRGVAAK